jgi:hypothetical protein
MVTSDAHEAREIKRNEQLKLPVSHIFKDGSFVQLESYHSVQRIPAPPAMEQADYIPDPDDTWPPQPNTASTGTPPTITSGLSTPVVLTPFTQYHQYSTPPPNPVFHQPISNNPTPGVPTPTRQINTDAYQPQVQTIIIDDEHDPVASNSEDETNIKVEDQESDDQNIQKSVKGKEKLLVPTINTVEDSPISRRTRRQIKSQKETSEPGSKVTVQPLRKHPKETPKSVIEDEKQSSNTIPSPPLVASPSYNLPQENTAEQMDFEINGLNGSFDIYMKFQDRSQLALLIHPNSEVRSQVTQQIAEVNRLYQQYLQAFPAGHSQRGRSTSRRREISPYPKTRKNPRKK